MKSLLLPFLVLLTISLNSQEFINGDFELTTAMEDQINLPNEVFNSLMPNCNSFGSSANLDIITSNQYDGGPQSGSWYTALTGGETDRLSIELSEPLVAGNNYTVTFYDKAFSGFVALNLQIGLSTVDNDLGTIVYTTEEPAEDGVWTERSFSFNAPNNGKFLTIIQAGALANWVQVDNFSITGSTDIVYFTENNNIKILENPTTDYLRMRSSEPVYNATLSVVSPSGLLVIKKDLKTFDFIDIDVSDLPKGFYVVYIETGGTPFGCYKFVKI